MVRAYHSQRHKSNTHPYAVLLSDLREPKDITVSRHASREEACEEAHLRNLRLIRKYGCRLPDGTPTPLYFAMWKVGNTVFPVSCESAERWEKKAREKALLEMANLQQGQGEESITPGLTIEPGE